MHEALPRRQNKAYVSAYATAACHVMQQPGMRGANTDRQVTEGSEQVSLNRIARCCFLPEAMRCAVLAIYADAPAAAAAGCVRVPGPCKAR